MAEGRTEVAHIVDHIVPLAHGGEDTDENTRNLCRMHNEMRTAEQFGFKRKPKTGEDGWPV
jgi:5-methylcytosine-specific restriction protein A